jgi:hypothetical protein
MGPELGKGAWNPATSIIWPVRTDKLQVFSGLSPTPFIHFII